MPAVTLASRLAAAEDALKALLVARPALAGIPVALGEPPIIKQEHIWTSEPAEGEERFDVTKQAGGTGQRAAVFELGAKVYVERLGDAFLATRDRVHVLAGEVELAVLEDHTIGGAVWFAEPIGVRRETGLFEDNRAALVTVRIRVTDYPT